MRIYDARIIAERLVEEFRPFCDRIEIAGSIRRGVANEVKDIEIVCIPKMVFEGSLFDAMMTGAYRDPQFCAAVRKYQKVKGEPTGKYTQRIIPADVKDATGEVNPLFKQEIKLDLFMCEPSNWGWIFLVRTGSADFSHDTARLLSALGYTSTEGHIHRKGDPDNLIETPEEADVFALLDLDWIPPCDREKRATTNETKPGKGKA